MNKPTKTNIDNLLLCTVADDGTIKDIGNPLTDLLAKAYFDNNMSLDETARTLEDFAPSKDSEAYNVWEQITKSVLEKQKLLMQ